jgi:hypothetical protein
MLNELQKGAGNNPDLTMGTFEAVLRGASSRSIIEAAERYSSGLVEGQSLRFAPSSAEFAAEVRKRQELQDAMSRPRLSAPTYIRGGPPFLVSLRKAQAKNAHLPILYESISYDQWRKLAKEVPAGSKWVAATGCIYGPETRGQMAPA